MRDVSPPAFEERNIDDQKEEIEEKRDPGHGRGGGGHEAGEQPAVVLEQLNILRRYAEDRQAIYALVRRIDERERGKSTVLKWIGVLMAMAIVARASFIMATGDEFLPLDKIFDGGSPISIITAARKWDSLADSVSNGYSNMSDALQSTATYAKLIDSRVYNVTSDIRAVNDSVHALNDRVLEKVSSTSGRTMEAVAKFGERLLQIEKDILEANVRTEEVEEKVETFTASLTKKLTEVSNLAVKRWKDFKSTISGIKTDIANLYGAQKRTDTAVSNLESQMKMFYSEHDADDAAGLIGAASQINSINEKIASLDDLRADVDTLGEMFDEMNYVTERLAEIELAQSIASTAESQRREQLLEELQKSVEDEISRALSSVEETLGGKVERLVEGTLHEMLARRAVQDTDVYEFVPHQSDVNEEITTAIFHWSNRRSDEPEGALALHLVGGDMLQLQNIAKRIHHVINTLAHSPAGSGGKHELVELNHDFDSCQNKTNRRLCLEEQMATHLKTHSGCVVFALDASDIAFEDDLTFLTAFTDDTSGYIPHPSGNMKVNKAALILLSNFGADKFPKLSATTDGVEHQKMAADTYSANKRLIRSNTTGNWSDRFTHRLEAQVPVLSPYSGVTEGGGGVRDKARRFVDRVSGWFAGSSR